jgi:hypothetical protein
MPRCCWTAIPSAVILKCFPKRPAYIISVFSDEKIAATRAEMLELANDYPKNSENADAIGQEFDPSLRSR